MTIRRHARALAALAIAASLYGMARLPSLSDEERAQLAARFRFTSHPLPELPGTPDRIVRDVHPSLRGIASWISSVGAAVALNDLDGSGLPDDLCQVETRSDRVMVAPVPGTGARYAPFALHPAPLRYDPATMAPMGCLPGDVNEDGRMDLVVYYWGRTPVAFLRLAGAPLDAAGYRAVELVPGEERWYSNAGTFADVDGDGHLDLVVGNYFPDGARILDARAGGEERMQTSMSRGRNGGGDRLLLWSGAGPASVGFREAAGALAAGAGGWTLAAGAADLDRDGLPELYFANDFGPDVLLHNRSRPGRVSMAPLRGAKTFATPPSKVLGNDSYKGMGLDFGDLNGDGLPDLYVSNIAGEFKLEESHFLWMSTGAIQRMRDGVAPYSDRSEGLGLSRSDWGWDARLADFDNDGVAEAVQATGFVAGAANHWPELHELAMGNDQLVADPGSWHRFTPGTDLSGHEHNPFFVRARDGRYYDLAAEVGLGREQVTRGIAVADVDGDGDLDFAVANQWEPSRFYRNDAPSPGAFLGLHLLLPIADAPAAATRARPGHPSADTPGRPAIGAAATVVLPDGTRRTAQVDGGTGHSGKRSSDLHFGLGAVPPGRALRVEIAWRGADGRLRRETRHLTPGWHTVVLGTTAARGNHG